VTSQALNPKGPTGQRFHILAPWSHSIFTHAQDIQAAKDFLVWLMDPKQVAGWYDIAVSITRPICTCSTTRRCGRRNRAICRTAIRWRRRICPGWPAPISRQQGESVAKYVVVHMFAKACGGKSTKEVIADAAAQLKQIFKPA